VSSHLKSSHLRCLKVLVAAGLEVSSHLKSSHLRCLKVLVAAGLKVLVVFSLMQYPFSLMQYPAPAPQPLTECESALLTYADVC
jgi:hypothetical protein